jgi:O-antigen/teichoic acid export membrane protein
LMSKPVACTFATCADWPSFAWLALVTFIRSFEHLDIRVGANRDYRYWPLAVAEMTSYVCGLVALLLITYKFENQYGYIAYLLVQVPLYVIISHLLASHKYHLSYRTPFVRGSLAFGLPLLLNGIGLAVMSQGDRWIVGSLLGLPSLGFYSLITLVVFVPLSGLFKIISPVIFAGLHNAKIETGQYDARLKLYCRAIPTIAAAFALGILGFYAWLVPTVFGDRFVLSESMIFLLAIIAYINIIRTDPQTSLLFNTQNTGKLAIAGQAPFIGLLATAGLVIVHPTIESALIGSLVGQIAGLCVSVYLVRPLLRPATYDYVFSASAMLAIIGAAGITVLSTRGGDILADRITIAGGFLIVVLTFAGLSIPGLYKKAYHARS